MKRYSVVLAIVGLFCLWGCEKEEDEEDKTNYQLLEGTWDVSEVTLLGLTGDGDGSYVRFSLCDSNSFPCSGVDFDASDTTSGTFTFSLIEDESKLAIVDTNSAGGSWNYNWSILTLDETTLKITVDVIIFGNIQYKFTKQ